ncbi:MAG: hypothetical protein AAF657_07995 [Acidobacteriota bacterium]
MASRSFHALFLRARDQYADSSRWTFLAVLGLALVHLVVVTPFIEDRRAQSQTSLERQRLDGIEDGLSELRAALQAIFAETETAMTPALDRLAEDLDLDLARLDATRQRIAAQAAAEAATDDDEPPAEEAAAQEPETTPRVLPFQLDNPDWVADLRDARNRDELLATLTPMVDQLITQPRYFDITRSWRDEALPRLEARIDAAAAIVPRLRGRFTEGRQQWEALVGSLNELGVAAQQLRFTPPEQPFWWTVPTLDGELALGLQSTIRGEIRRPRGLSELQTVATRSGESFEAVRQRLEVAREALGETQDANSVVFQLAAAIPMFPLLLGLLLGSAVARRSQRLRELGIATHLAIEHGGPPALQRWLWSQVQWSQAVQSAAGAWRRCVTQTLLGYFLAMGWIALAAVQLRQLPSADRQRLMIVTLAGAAIVLVAIVHRLLIARRAIEPPDPASDEEAETTEEAEGDAPPVFETDIDLATAAGREVESPGDAPQDGAAQDDTPQEGEATDSELIDVRPLRR